MAKLPDQHVITPESRTVTTEQILSGLERKIAEVTPEPKPEPSAPLQGGAIFKEGRIVGYRYDVDGQSYITPKPLEDMSEQDFYDLPVSVYGNEANRTPQRLTVKFRDPQWAGYWFNFKAGQGRRIGDALSQGYVPAKKEDLDWHSPHLNTEDGGVVDGDVVLYKINKAKLFLAYKRNMDMAKQKGSVESYMQQAQNSRSGDVDKAPYYLSNQAKQEFQGLGPVTHLPEVGS